LLGSKIHTRQKAGCLPGQHIESVVGVQALHGAGRSRSETTITIKYKNWLNSHSFYGGSHLQLNYTNYLCACFSQLIAR
jgi:hypothetical protein